MEYIKYGSIINRILENMRNNHFHILPICILNLKFIGNACPDIEMQLSYRIMIMLGEFRLRCITLMDLSLVLVNIMTNTRIYIQNLQ